MDETRVEELRSARVSFFEEGLPELVAAGLRNGRLRFASSLEAGLDAAGQGPPEILFVCTPTPLRDGRLDITITRAAIEAARRHLSPQTVVVVKSTVPIGFTASISPTAVSNPEFLRAGSGPFDFMHPDRIVVGATDPGAGDIVAGLYEGLGPIVRTDPSSSELAKLAANSFLAVKASFINELATVAEAHHADVTDVARIIGMDARIGPSYLQVGPGWGGPCLPKDSAELAAVGMTIVGDARWLNDAQTDRIVAKVMDACDGMVSGAKIAVWGLAFKPGSDDVLESPAMRVVRSLRRAGAIVTAFDPFAKDPETDMVDTPLVACEGADVLVIFDDQDIPAAAIPVRNVVDARNSRPLAEWQAAGMRTWGVGRT